tara:strand:+ start:3950 stop:4825 length:876 start_codon:yes stop_codon:yes gene_type:complete
MTFQNAVDEIREFNAGYNLVEESVLTKGLTAHIINQKRARVINEQYNRHGQINWQWVQDMGVYDTTRVDFTNDLDSADVLASGSKCEVARLEIPNVVAIESDRHRIQDLGIVMIKGTVGQRYDRTTRDKFLTWMNTGDPRSRDSVYWREGNAIFIYPWKAQVNAQLILEDPREGFIIQNGNVKPAGLVPGVTYEVHSGYIDYLVGVTLTRYQKGTTFVATTTGGVSWVGLGEVRMQDRKRTYRMSDNYPIDGSIWHHIKEMIIKDLQQGKGFIGDAVHDGADEESLRESRE